MRIQTIFSKKSIALLTAMIFLVSNAAWAAPQTAASIDIAGAHKVSAEASVFSLAGAIDFPRDIGSVKDRYVAENSKGENSLSPVIVHIQDAHTSYEAQENIRKILNHLSEEYRFDTVFLEGGIGKIDADRIRFFQKESSNQKLAELLTQDGLIGGVEWFLLDATAQKDGSKISAMGVETPDLYLKNLAAYRHVAAQQENAEAFLGRMKLNMLTLGSHVFEKALRAFFKEWLFYQDSPSEIMRHLNTLKKFAGEQLKIDFSNPQMQTEWPELYRIFRLEEIEKTLQPGKINEEETRLNAWIREKKLDEKYAECFSQVLRGKPVKNAQAREPRRLVEEFYDRAADLGFSFTDYPNSSIAFGVWILRSEIRADALFKEAELLSAKILEKLSDGPSSKALLAAYKDYLLLKKLWSLQLTPEDYATVLQNKETLLPSRLTARIAGIAANGITGNALAAPKERGLAAADKLHQMALDFYAGARAREEEIYRNMIEKMRARGAANAVLVTGGFHSTGMAEIFKKNHISYIHVTPHIADIAKETKYADVMALKTDRITRRSTVNSPRAVTDAQIAQGLNTRELTFYIAALGRDIAVTMAEAGKTAADGDWPSAVRDFNDSTAARQWDFSVSADGIFNVGKTPFRDALNRTLSFTPTGPQTVVQSRLEMRAQKSMVRKLGFEPLEARQLLTGIQDYPLPDQTAPFVGSAVLAEGESQVSNVAQGTATLSNPDYTYVSRQVSTGIWEYDILKTGTVVATIPGPQSVSGSQSIHSNLAVPGQGPDVSPNGQHLMTVMKGTATVAYQAPSSFQTILIYDLNGNLQKRVSLPYDRQLTDVRFTDSNLIRVTDAAGVLSFYDPATGDQVSNVAQGTAALSNPDYTYVSRQVSTGIWEYDILKTGTVVATIPGPQSVSGSQSIHSNLAVPGQGPDVSPNGQHLMTVMKGTATVAYQPPSSFQTILIYDLAGKLQKRVSLPYDRQLTDVRFTDSNLIRVTDAAGVLSFYDPATGDQVSNVAQGTATLSNPDYTYVSRQVSTGIWEYDILKTGTVVATIPGPQSVSGSQSIHSNLAVPGQGPDVSPNGQHLMTVMKGTATVAYQPPSSFQTILIYDLAGKLQKRVSLPYDRQLTDVRFTDSNLIRVTDAAGVLSFYDPATGNLVTPLKQTGDFVASTGKGTVKHQMEAITEGTATTFIPDRVSSTGEVLRGSMQIRMPANTTAPYAFYYFPSLFVQDNGSYKVVVHGQQTPTEVGKYLGNIEVVYPHPNKPDSLRITKNLADGSLSTLASYDLTQMTTEQIQTVLTYEIKKLLQIPQPAPVPAGWTQVTLKPQFAHREIVAIAADGHLQGLQSQVMDLSTGQIYVSPGFPSPTRTNLSFLGIDETNSFAIAQLSAQDPKLSAATPQVLLWALNDSGNSLTLTGTYRTHSHNPTNGNIELWTVQANNTLTKTIISQELKVLEAVPSGWTLTPSNPNFASIIERSYVGNGIYNLTAKVRNLVTGEELTVSSGQTPPYPGPRGAFDVSPDGTTVVFAYEGMYTPYGPVNYIILEHLANLSEQLQLPGEFGSVRFSEGTAILETTGEDVNRRHQVDLNALVNTDTTYILANPAATTITYHQDAQLVAQIKRVQTTDRINIYDSANGTDRMSLLKDRAVTTGYPSDTVTFVNIYRTPGGRGIVSYSAETYAPSTDYDYTTVLFDPRTGDELRLNGRATSVTYEGAVAQFNLTHRSGVSDVVKVDLETLQILPQVTAYRITTERVDGKTMYVFRDQNGNEVCRRSFGENVMRVDAYSDGMIVVNYMKDAPEGPGAKVYAMIDEPSVGPHYEIADMAAIADVRRGTLGELVIRGTTTDQQNNLTVTIANGQMTRTLESFPVIQPAPDQNLPLTPLSQSILEDSHNVDVYSAGKPGTTKFYWLAHSTVVGQGDTDEGFGFVLGNNKDQRLIPQNLADLTHLVMRTGSTNGTARVEIVAQKMENGIAKEIKDSVTVVTTADVQTYSIPMSAFRHIDFSNNDVKLVYIINAGEAHATMLAQTGPQESRIVSWNIAGQRVFYTNASHENWMLNQETSEKNIGVLSSVYHEFAFFYRDVRDNQSIRIEDTQTGGQPVAIFATGNNSTNGFLAASPDGRYALIGKAYAGVYLVDLKTNTMKIVGVPSGPQGIVQATFPASNAAVLTAEKGQKWILNLATGSVTRILPGKTAVVRSVESGRLIEYQVFAWKGNKIILTKDVTYQYNAQGKRVSHEIQYFNGNGTLRLDQWFNQANKLVYSLTAAKTGVLKTMTLYHPATKDRMKISFNAVGKPKTILFYHGETKKMERIPAPATLAAVPDNPGVWTLTANHKVFTLRKATGQITVAPASLPSAQTKAVDAILAGYPIHEKLPAELLNTLLPAVAADRKVRAELRLTFTESYLRDYFAHEGLVSLEAATNVFHLAGRSVSRVLPPAMAAAFLDYNLAIEESAAAFRSESEDANPLREIAREALGEYAWVLDDRTGAVAINPIFPVLSEDATVQQCIPFLPFIRPGDRFDLVMNASDERAAAFQAELRNFARKLGLSEKLAAQIWVQPSSSNTEIGYAKTIEKIMARHPFTGNRGIPSRLLGLLEKVGERGARRMLMPERLKQQVVSLMTPVRLRNDDMAALRKIEIFEEWMREHNVHIDTLAANVTRMVQVIERLAASA